MSTHARVVFLLLTVAFAGVAFAQNFTVHCHWGATAPTAQPNSRNVISTPVVLNLRGTGSSSQVAFISYEKTSQLANDGEGVLRVMDAQCQELARFPDPACTVPPLQNAPNGFGGNPLLAPVSGLAAGDLDRDGIPEIVAVIGDGTNPHRQLAAFNLVGNCLAPRWVSADTLPVNDAIAPAAPAIAQLDRPGGSGLTVPWDHAEVIVDNKIYDSNGSRRFTAFSFQNYCGNAPCPRSRTAIAALLPGHVLPGIITGRGIYRSQGGTTWHMSFGPAVNIMSAMSNSGLTYPAVAELDGSSVGPEIVVVDTLQGPGGTLRGTLWVLRASGATLASTPISGAQCGGPPMIGNADGIAGPEIGVATCNAYTLYRYDSNSHTITPVWSRAISDLSGQTTSTLYNGPQGARIVYADEARLYILDGATGAIRQQIPNGSATAFEGPVVASFDTGHPAARCAMSKGRLVVAANDGSGGSIRGVRIFHDATGDIGNVGSCWNENAFHVTNVSTGAGLIPQFEAPSWVSASPARNTYRVQAWP